MDTVLTLRNKQKLIGMLKQHFQIERLEDFIKTISTNEDEKVDLMLIAFSMYGRLRAEITTTTIVKITSIKTRIAKLELIKAVMKVTGRTLRESKSIADLMVTCELNPLPFKIGTAEGCILDNVEWNKICEWMNKNSHAFQWKGVCAA